jgi:hypothetical protein
MQARPNGAIIGYAAGGHRHGLEHGALMAAAPDLLAAVVELATTLHRLQPDAPALETAMRAYLRATEPPPLHVAEPDGGGDAQQHAAPSSSRDQRGGG